MKITVENFEIEVLERSKLEDIISDLDRDKVAERLLRLADGYEFSGTAYIYVDAETGKLKEGWIQQGTSLHPVDKITKIVVMDESTPFKWEDVLDEAIIDPASKEYVEYKDWTENQEWDTDVFTFLEEKYGKEGLEERKSLIYEGFIDNMEWRDDIGEQLDALYSMIEE